MTIQAIQQALRQEALHPGTIDKIDLIQQIHHLLQPDTTTNTTKIPSYILTWYAATLDRWRRSLRAYRPLAESPPPTVPESAPSSPPSPESLFNV